MSYYKRQWWASLLPFRLIRWIGKRRDVPGAFELCEPGCFWIEADYRKWARSQ